MAMTLKMSVEVNGDNRRKVARLGAMLKRSLGGQQGVSIDLENNTAAGQKVGEILGRTFAELQAVRAEVGDGGAAAAGGKARAPGARTKAAPSRRRARAGKRKGGAADGA